MHKTNAETNSKSKIDLLSGSNNLQSAALENAITKGSNVSLLSHRQK